MQCLRYLSLVTCNCGLVLRDHNDVIEFNCCNERLYYDLVTPMRVKVRSKQRLSPGISITQTRITFNSEYKVSLLLRSTTLSLIYGMDHISLTFAAGFVEQSQFTSNNPTLGENIFQMSIFFNFNCYCVQIHRKRCLPSTCSDGRIPHSFSCA